VRCCLTSRQSYAAEGVEFTAFGLALVKALILGKFILVLQAIKMDEPRDKRGILLIDILKTSILFLIFLVALSAVEEIALGYFHGRAVHEVLGEMAGALCQRPSPYAYYCYWF
jgi:hypothetical protein